MEDRQVSQSSKPVFKLTQSDLRDCPVWEYIAEPVGRQTEEWVRPRKDVTTVTVRSLTACFNIVVAATFTFPDGARRPGYCHAISEPMLRRLFESEDRTDLALLSFLSPVVFGKVGSVDFNTGRQPTAAELKRHYVRLGQARNHTFPISFAPTIAVGKGVTATGTVPAFFWSATTIAITI
jgi:hypothetical protein